MWQGQVPLQPGDYYPQVSLSCADNYVESTTNLCLLPGMPWSVTRHTYDQAREEEGWMPPTEFVHRDGVVQCFLLRPLKKAQ